MADGVKIRCSAGAGPAAPLCGSIVVIVIIAAVAVVGFVVGERKEHAKAHLAQRVEKA